MSGTCYLAILLFAAAGSQLHFPAADVRSMLEKIQAAGREGAGNPEAARAWRDLVAQGPGVLPAILSTFDDRNPVTSNWLRAAVDAIAERELARRRSLPTRVLESFVIDTRHPARGRRIAYECLARVDPTAPQRLLPGMLYDPSSELRREAVGATIEAARKLENRGDAEAAIHAYRKALAAAHDIDQVEEITRTFTRLGTEVDLASHFGFIRKWMVIGPFDNTGKHGFHAVLPPEARVDLNASCTGKRGVELRWREETTGDAYGVVDLNKMLGKELGVIGYAFTSINAIGEQEVEIRVGSDNAVKLFLNRTEVFRSEEYHHGIRMDQYVIPVRLRPGPNEILLKVCQDEQKEDWAEIWSFQLRMCDSTGTPVFFREVSSP